MVIMMIDYKLIGRRIAFYRKSASVTQAAMSERLGVTESYVSQVERGTTKVSLSRLSQIADALDVDIAQLVSDGGVISAEYVNPEIAKILSGWTAEQIAMLTDLLICADERIKALNE